MQRFFTKSPGLGFLVWLALAVVAYSAIGTARAACTLEPAGQGRVASVTDGRTFTLADGTVVRLDGIELPGREDFTPQGRGLYGAAARRLRALVAGRVVRFFRVGRTEARDRHGRLVVHGFVRSGGMRVWLQGELVGEGLGFAAPAGRSGDCLSELLDREGRARRKRAGLWHMKPGPVIGARDLGALYGARDRFRIVVGEVRDAAVVGGRIYLNFGDDWRRDFTVIVAPRDRRAFMAVHGDPTGLKGRRVRVRGWIMLRNGPAVTVAHPDAIEMLAPVRPRAVAGG